MVQDTFYKIIERNVENVSIQWKVYHILLFIVASISGFFVSFSFGHVLSAFGNNCILYSQLVFENDSAKYYTPLGPFPNDTSSFFNSNTIWGNESMCKYCQFIFLYTAILALVFMAFFLMCSRGGSGYQNDLMDRPYQIVFPMIIFTFIAGVVVVVGYVNLNGGIKVFCAQFIDELQNQTTSCTEELNIYTLLFNQEKKEVYLYLLLTKYVALISLICWLVQFLLLIVRLVVAPDFTIILKEIFVRESTKTNTTKVDDISDLDDESNV